MVVVRLGIAVEHLGCVFYCACGLRGDKLLASLVRPAGEQGGLCVDPPRGSEAGHRHKVGAGRAARVAPKPRGHVRQNSRDESGVVGLFGASGSGTGRWSSLFKITLRGWEGGGVGGVAEVRSDVFPALDSGGGGFEAFS